MSSAVESLPTRHVDAASLRELATGVVADPGDRESIPVEAPATGDRIGSVPAGTPEDVERAFARARAAQADWADRPVAERAAVLERLESAVFDRRPELLDLVQLESGKTRLDAFEEVTDVALNAGYYARNGPKELAATRRRGAFPLLTRAVEYRDPVGVVGAISPWNYPLTLAVSDVLPALLAGNGVVLKPAEGTPYTALIARELLVDAGLPPDLFQVVTGYGEAVGPALIGESDFVNFTGSTETGRVVARQAGDHLVDCSLELGGQGPMVVCPDADVEAAAAGAAQGAFASAGQLCIATERIYVHEAVYDDFVDALVPRVRSLSLGTSFEYGDDVGSLAGDDALSTVQAHVDDAVERGATVLTGGRHRPDVGPYAYEPTVLTDVDDDTTVACEETFGPVVWLRSVPSVDAAVREANDSRYGLHASVWTGDAERGRTVARRIDAGSVTVNDPYPAVWASTDAPIGGRKDSGIGRRHGSQGLTKFTTSQTVATHRGPAIRPPDRVPDGLYARALTVGIGLLRRVGLR